MAMKNTPFGKDRVVKSSESFIEKALTGGHGPSAGIQTTKVDRPDQEINTAFPMDNVKLVQPMQSSIRDTGGFAGGIDNLKHSLTGGSAVNEEVGAAGPVKHVIIPNH